MRNFHPVINTIIGLIRAAVYANFWVAGAVWALTLVSESVLQYSGPSFAVFNGGLTLIFYGFARFFEGPSDAEEISKITSWRKRMPQTTVLSMIIGAGISTLSLSSIGPHYALVHYLIAGAIAMLYPLPRLFPKFGGGLRSIPGMKLFIIAVTWAYITAGIPAIISGNQFWPIFIERFFWTAALTIPFDIRDARIDSSDLKTLPHVFGPRNAAFFANAFLWISFAFYPMVFGLDSGIMFLTFFFFATVLLLANEKMGDLYFSLLIEGFPYLLLGIVWLLPYL
ncbi:MAG: hypothetical protein RL754_505 [Bacteroidota bacterium]